MGAVHPPAGRALKIVGKSQGVPVCIFQVSNVGILIIGNAGNYGPGLPTAGSGGSDGCDAFRLLRGQYCQGKKINTEKEQLLFHADIGGDP